MTPMPHRGRWQAQGSDIRKPKGGHSVAWDKQHPPTKQDGVNDLTTLADKCEALQRSLRETAFLKAKRWVERLPSEGYSTVGNSKPFYVSPPHPKNKNARVDLEVFAGKAFSLHNSHADR